MLGHTWPQCNVHPSKSWSLTGYLEQEPSTQVHALCYNHHPGCHGIQIHLQAWIYHLQLLGAQLAIAANSRWFRSNCVCPIATLNTTICSWLSLIDGEVFGSNCIFFAAVLLKKELKSVVALPLFLFSSFRSTYYKQSSFRIYPLL